MFRYLPLIFALVFDTAPAAEPAAVWKTELESGKKALAAHDYAEATARFRSALAQAEAAPGEDAAVLETLRACATSLRLQSRFDDAAQFLNRAVPVATKLSGETSLELASVLSELAGIERTLGHRAEALALLQKAVLIRESHTEGREDLARDLTSLARLRMALGETAAVKPTLLQALSAWERAVAPDDLRLLPVLDELAAIHRDGAEYKEAEPLYVRALMIREAALGPDASELLATMDSLAYVYFGQKKYSDAEPVYARLLSLWEASTSPDHLMVAVTLDKMAEFYAVQGRYEEAEPLVTRSLAIRSRWLIASMNQTGRVQLMQARLSEAEALYERALRIGDDLKVADDAMDPVLRVYAKLLRELKRPEEAAVLDERVKAAGIRKGEREGLRPSPVKLP